MWSASGPSQKDDRMGKTEQTETVANFGAVLKNLIGHLVFLTLRDGTRLKGDVTSVRKGTVELHTFSNVHFLDIGEVAHVAVAKGGSRAHQAGSGVEPDVLLRHVGGAKP